MIAATRVEILGAEWEGARQMRRVWGAVSAAHHGVGRIGSAPAAIATLVLLLVAGGCGLQVDVQVKEATPVSPKVRQVLAAGEGSWDLRTPPSRAEAGMPPGEPYVIYVSHDRQRDPPFCVHVLLPEGKRLDTPGRRRVRLPPR